MPDGRWVCAYCGMIFDLHEGTEYQIHSTKCNNKKNIQKEKIESKCDNHLVEENEMVQLTKPLHIKPNIHEQVKTLGLDGDAFGKTLMDIHKEGE